MNKRVILENAGQLKNDKIRGELAPTMNFKTIPDDCLTTNLKNTANRQPPKQPLGAGTHGFDVQEVSLSGFNESTVIIT